MTSQIKPNYDDNRQILADIIPLRTPLAIQVAPSSVCNFKCNYCIQSSPDMKDKKIMEWDTFEKLCEQLKGFDDKLKQITFAGWGEPLVNRDLPKMISHIKKTGVVQKVAVFTNGLLLKRDALSLVDAGADFIKISLQGMSTGKYKEISGVKLDFDDLVADIKFLYENRKDCKIFIKIGDIDLTENEKELFYSTFRNITDRMYIESIRPIFENLSSSAMLKDKKIMSKFGELHSPVIICPQPFYMMNITPQGDVLPCCAYYDPANLGNIHSISLKEIWNGKKMRMFLRAMLRADRKDQKLYPVCRTCEIPDVTIVPSDELDSHAEKLQKKYGQE